MSAAFGLGVTPGVGGSKSRSLATGQSHVGDAQVPLLATISGGIHAPPANAAPLWAISQSRAIAKGGRKNRSLFARS